MSQISTEQIFSTISLNDQSSSVELIEQILISSMSEHEAAEKLNLVAKQLLGRDAQVALNCAQKAREFAEKLQQKDLLAEAFANIASAYFNLARYDEALDYGYRALQLSEEVASTHTKAKTMHVIGCVNLHLGEYDQALNYFMQSAEIFEKQSDKFAYSNALMNVGSVYFHRGKYQDALTYYLKTKSIRETLSDERHISEVLVNIGAAYHALGESEKAIEWMKKSLNVAKSERDVSVEILGLINLGEVYASVNQNYKAIDTLLDSIKLAGDKAEHRQYLWIAYLNLAEIYKKVDKYKEALEAYEKYVQLKEKIFDTEAERKIKAKRDAEIDLAQKKIKQLEEIVTMCAWSGKIQMNGKWVKIEEFLNERFGIKVSHGISEEEAAKVRKEINNESQNQTGEQSQTGDM